MDVIISTKTKNMQHRYPSKNFSFLEARQIVKSGTGASVGIPKAHLGKRAIVIILEEGEDESCNPGY